MRLRKGKKIANERKAKPHMELEREKTKITETTLREIDEHVINLCMAAHELEQNGDYEGARHLLSEFWTTVGEEPQLEGLGEMAQAEIILRVGTLTGWIGSSRQIEGAQEKAKDLISEAGTRFVELNMLDRAADAMVDLGICYWRNGAMDEARIIFQDAIHQLSNSSPTLRARALLNSALPEISTGQYDKAISIHQQAAPLYMSITDDAARGRYHGALALAFRKRADAEKRPDDMDRAIEENAAASYYIAKSGNHRYYARIENNLGFLLYKIGKYGDAHKHLENARRTFADVLRDPGSAAQVNDTRARVYIAQRQYQAAERIAWGARHALSKGDETSLLAEATITYGVALARLNKTEQARGAFTYAASVAERHGNRAVACDAVITMLEETGESFSLKEYASHYEAADRLLYHSEDKELERRLRDCARLLCLKAQQPTDFDLGDATTDGNFEETLKRVERMLILPAIEKANGNLTQASKLLGFDHHWKLTSLLKNHHPDLLELRDKPPQPRRRSIMKPEAHKKPRKRRTAHANLAQGDQNS
jgi:tetratricopeptide (TPR) repeat protein